MTPEFQKWTAVKQIDKCFTNIGPLHAEAVAKAIFAEIESRCGGSLFNVGVVIRDLHNEWFGDRSTR
jgi:hypothetical protein